MKWNILSLLSAAALLAGGMSINAHAAAERPAFRRGALAERAKEKLGLTDDQVAKIRTELASEKDSIKDLLQRLHTARSELRDVIQQPTASEGSIRDAAAKVAKVESDAAVLRAKLYHNIAPVLTDEQKAKIKEARQKAGALADRLMERIGARRRGQ